MCQTRLSSEVDECKPLVAGLGQSGEMGTQTTPFALRIGVDKKRYPHIQIDDATQLYDITNTATTIGCGASPALAPSPLHPSRRCPVSRVSHLSRSTQTVKSRSLLDGLPATFTATATGIGYDVNHQRARSPGPNPSNLSSPSVPMPSPSLQFSLLVCVSITRWVERLTKGYWIIHNCSRHMHRLRHQHATDGCVTPSHSAAALTGGEEDVAIRIEDLVGAVG